MADELETGDPKVPEDNIAELLGVLSTGLSLQHQQWDALDAKAGITIGTSAGLVILLVGWATTAECLALWQKIGIALNVFVFVSCIGIAWTAMRPRTVWGIPVAESLSDFPPNKWALSMMDSIRENREMLEPKANAVWLSFKVLALQVALSLAVTLLSV